MIRITDKSFQYTTSFNTDLRKKFRKLQQDKRAAAARNAAPEPAGVNAVMSIVTRRGAPNA